MGPVFRPSPVAARCWWSRRTGVRLGLGYDMFVWDIFVWVRRRGGGGERINRFDDDDNDDDIRGKFFFLAPGGSKVHDSKFQVQTQGQGQVRSVS